MAEYEARAGAGTAAAYLALPSCLDANSNFGCPDTRAVFQTLIRDLHVCVNALVSNFTRRQNGKRLCRTIEAALPSKTIAKEGSGDILDMSKPLRRSSSKKAIDVVEKCRGRS